MSSLAMLLQSSRLSQTPTPSTNPDSPDVSTPSTPASTSGELPDTPSMDGNSQATPGASSILQQITVRRKRPAETEALATRTAQRLRLDNTATKELVNFSKVCISHLRLHLSNYLPLTRFLALTGTTID